MAHHRPQHKQTNKQDSTLAGRARINNSTSENFNKHLSKPCMMRTTDPSIFEEIVFEKSEPRNLSFRMPNGHVSCNLCDQDTLGQRESEIVALKEFENMC